MALSAPRNIYGIHSVSPYSRTDGTFYGIIKVLDSSSLSMSGSPVELMGGSQKFAWAVEDGPIKAEMSLKFSQFENFMFTLFMGVTPTSNSAEATGNVGTITNKKGTSVVAATGIASVTLKAGESAKLKFGKYVVKCTAATKVKVYCSTDAEFSRGATTTYNGDDLEVTSAELTIAQGAAVEIPTMGLELTGGAGVIGMTIGDTATFEIRPINTKSSVVTVGAAENQTFPEFGCIIMAQKRGNLELFELDAFRCKAAGMPIGFDANAFAKGDVKVSVFYDSVRNGVFSVRAVNGA